MICINKLTDKDFNLENKPLDNPRHRYGARGIVFNSKNEIAVLYKKYKNEYKLIGGGIDEGEDPKAAFQREVLEEAGCKVEIDEELGIFEEIKSQDNFIQTSHIYLSHIIEDTGKKHFTEKELCEGATLIWCDLDRAMFLIKDSENKIVASKFESEMSVYHTKFIVRRDYEILKYYKENYIK